MVAPVPAQISKLRPRLPAAALRPPLLTTHHSLPTFCSFKRSTPLLPITSLQPQQFHAITHSFAQRRAAIPPIFNSFRTLSIVTGVYPSATPVLLAPRPLCRAFPSPRVLKPANSRVCIGLPPLCTLSCTRFLCFQQLAASFPKTPGVGVSRMYLSRLRTRRRR
jgi:hypothetical protein